MAHFNEEHRIALKDAIHSADHVVLVCGEEKIGKSSLITLLKGLYYPNVLHEYAKHDVNSKKKRSKITVPTTMVEVAYKQGDDTRCKKLCFCELSTMRGVYFQKQLAEVIKLSGRNDGSRASVVDNINVCTKITAIIYITSDNMVSRHPTAFYQNLFEIAKDAARSASSDRAEGNGEAVSASKMQRKLQALFEIEKTVAYATENNNLKWLANHMTLKKIPTCLMLNSGYDLKELHVLDELLEEHLNKMNNLLTIDGTKSSMDVKKTLTEFYNKQKTKSGENAMCRERLTSYCDMIKKMALNIMARGYAFSHVSTLLDLGLIEELKKGSLSTQRTRAAKVMEIKRVEENEIPRRVVRGFLPLVSNSYGIPHIDGKPEHYLLTLANTAPEHGSFFVCKAKWGNEMEEYSHDPTMPNQVLAIMDDMEKLELFKKALAQGHLTNDGCTNSYVVLFFWLLMSKNKNAY